MKTEEEIIEHNMQVFLKEESSKFTYTALAKFDKAYTAKCETGKHILKTGLGFMGVGSLWFDVTEEHLPLLESLPVKKCSGICIIPCE